MNIHSKIAVGIDLFQGVVTDFEVRIVNYDSMFLCI